MLSPLIAGLLNRRLASLRLFFRVLNRRHIQHDALGRDAHFAQRAQRRVELRMAVAHVASQSDEVPSVHSAKLGKNVGRAAEHRILLRKTLISCHS